MLSTVLLRFEPKYTFCGLKAKPTRKKPYSTRNNKRSQSLIITSFKYYHYGYHATSTFVLLSREELIREIKLIVSHFREFGGTGARADAG
jgi:hypothetical protein